MAALHVYATPITGPDVHHLGGRNSLTCWGSGYQPGLCGVFSGCDRECICVVIALTSRAWTPPPLQGTRRSCDYPSLLLAASRYRDQSHQLTPAQPVVTLVVGWPVCRLGGAAQGPRR